eukprot:gene9651-10639_t
MLNSNSLNIGVISKIPNIASNIVRKLPRLAPQVTDLLQQGPHGPISVSDLLSKGDNERRNITNAMVANSDILVADMDVIAPIVYQLDKVKWVQSTWAGVDFLLQGLDDKKPYPKYKITRFAGRFGQHMAEYVIGHIIAKERNFKEIYKSQAINTWDFVVQTKEYRLLNSLSISILGLGDIGKHLAKICKEFDMNVRGFVSKEVPENFRCSFVDKYYNCIEDLPELLQQSDYICNTLPKTPKTDGILSNGMLKNCQERKSVLVNIGRGNIIKEDDIINALELGWIGGAVLDVFNEEPLPKTSKLWEFPNVTITPHCSGLSLANEVADVFVENYELFEKDRELNHILDWAKGY